MKSYAILRTKPCARRKGGSWQQHCYRGERQKRVLKCDKNDVTRSLPIRHEHGGNMPRSSSSFRFDMSVLNFLDYRSCSTLRRKSIPFDSTLLCFFFFWFLMVAARICSRTPNKSSQINTYTIPQKRIYFLGMSIIPYLVVVIVRIFRVI